MRLCSIVGWIAMEIVPLGAAAFLFLAGSVFGEESKPNIIVIMADDLGYGDVGCYGSKTIPTPHLDRMAAEGIRFTSGYSPASTCTPTRYSLLTGEFAFRRKGTGVAPPNSPLVVPVGKPTLPLVLKQAGYRTGVIGKWHLGLGGPDGPDWNGSLRPGPMELGFDDCFILPTTNDRVPQVFVRQDRVEGLDTSDPLWVGEKKPTEDHPTGITHRDQLKMNWSHGHNATIHNGVSRIGFYTGGQKARFRDEDLTDHWVTEAKRWITEHQEKPFFLLFCSHAIHVPRVVHERYQGVSGHGPRGDAIVELDDSVGAIRQTLKSLDLDRKTLIVFCSDNGPVLDDGYQDDAIERLGEHDPNGPFRGGKYNVYEAGTRTPLLACWPGTTSPQVSDQVLCSVDFAATFTKLAGATAPEGAYPDSVDLSDLMTGKPNAKGRAHLLTQDNGQSGQFGLREGRWKLIRAPAKKATNVQLRLVPTEIPEWQLFDLQEDPGESNNVIDKHPDIALPLKRKLQKLLEGPVAQ